ncbi:MAG: hypothetical protein AABY00_00665 [Nanoarchaeota archaeon]
MVMKMNNRSLQAIIETVGTPTFVYSENTLIANVKRVIQAISTSGIQNKINLYVSYFANSNPHLASLLESWKVGLTLQSLEENEQLKRFGLNSISKVLSPTHLSREDLNYFTRERIPINCATLSNLELLLKCGADEPRIRVDLSPESNQRQGIKPGQFPEVKALLKKYGKTLYGIQMYAGTGNGLEVHTRFQTKGFECLSDFPELKEINLGGGFKFDYEKQEHFEWLPYFRTLKERIQKYALNSNVVICIEPGRDVLADVGQLVLQVNGVEKTWGKECYEIFTNGSYVYMPSATIRPRQHHLQFYDSTFSLICNESHKEKAAQLSGNTTLSSDRLFPGIVYIPSSLKEGDYIIVEDVGAYCATQHMDFLNKTPAAEVLIRKNGTTDIITSRGNLTDKTRYVLSSPQTIRRKQ